MSSEREKVIAQMRDIYGIVEALGDESIRSLIKDWADRLSALPAGEGAEVARLREENEALRKAARTIIGDIEALNWEDADGTTVEAIQRKWWRYKARAEAAAHPAPAASVVNEAAVEAFGASYFTAEGWDRMAAEQKHAERQMIRLALTAALNGA